MTHYIWIIDPETQEHLRVSLDELDPEILPKVLRPTAGFCYEGNAFVHLPLTSADSYIQDWLPKQGKAMFYAPAKSGKSFLALQMARCIAQGLPFLTKRTTQGRVLYLQFEMGTTILQKRMRDTGQDYSDVFVGTSFSTKLDTEDGRNLVHRVLSEIEPNVLILDPFYKVLTGDENEVVDVRAVLDFLDLCIETYNCSVIIIHHAGKDLARGSRGSSLLEGWVDSNIEVKKTFNSPMKIKVTPKHLRHAELPPEPIEAIMRDFEFEAELPDTVESRVRKELSFGAEVKAEQLITDKVGSRRAIYDTFKTLVDVGEVVKVNRGVYKLVGS